MIHESYLIKFVAEQLYNKDAHHILLVFISVLSIVSFLQWLLKTWRDIKSLPPGPWGFPVIGYLAFIGNEKHTRFMELSKRYGSMFSTRLGNQLTVVMSDYKIIRECFRLDEFTGRPHTPLMQSLNGLGIINSMGNLWKDQRRFLHGKLRLLGMTYMGSGKHLMERRIMTEVDAYISDLKLLCERGQPIDLSPSLSVAVSNVITSILMSRRFKSDDPTFRRLNFLIEEGMRLFGEIHTVDYIPTAKYLPGHSNIKNKIAKNRAEMMDFYKEVIEEHRRTYDPAVCRDMIDVYLGEIEKAQEEGRADKLFEGRDKEEQIIQVLIDLFTAGTETVKTTLLWLNVFLLRNPDAMKRVQDELDQVVGRHRLPSTEDLPFLPITESTIFESMRRSSIVPLATTHSPTRDMEVNGYKIPAGSHVVPLINCVHMDPKLWDKPEEFNPRRFINAEGKVQKPEFFIPFGVGRRMCLGELLAKMELFLFFASFMHTFNISLPEGHPMPSLKGNVGVTISPDLFNVCLTPRPLIDVNEIHAQTTNASTSSNTCTEPHAPQQQSSSSSSS